MRHGHTPFGYRIENGAAVANEDEAEQIRQIYREYLSGKSYIEAAKSAGVIMTHRSVKRMLQNKHYLGDDFYPAIIDRENFEAAEAERKRRLELMCRADGKTLVTNERKIRSRFFMRAITENIKDPYARAAYIYSLIESED